MCRNITTLRGLEPLATPQEIEAAARQYVRKISGVQKTSPATEAAFERAVLTITQASSQLLRELPPRKQPPPTLPPLRRIALAKAATVALTGYESAGTRSNQGAARSNCAANCNSTASAPALAMKCVPTGSPCSFQCSGTDIAG